jgi:magnesium transporter
MTIQDRQIRMLKKYIRHDAGERLENFLNRFRPAETAEVMTQLPSGERKKLSTTLLERPEWAATFVELPNPLLDELLGALPNDKIGKLLQKLAPDDAVYIASRLGEERAEAIIDELPKRARERIEHLRLYPAESAGSIMTSEMVLLEDDMTAEEGLQTARQQGQDTEFIFYLYVVIESGVFLGVVPIRRLISAPKDARVKELMVPDPIAVYAEDDQEEVAEVTAKYDLHAVPVVDDNFHLIGVITSDDILDVVQEEATEDMYRMQGLNEEDRVHSPVFKSVRKRFPWMALNLGTAFLASYIVGLFEESITEVVALATLMPIVAGIGGNGGTQTLTVITRGMAIGELEFSDGFWAAGKQISIGLLIGAGIGLLAGGGAWLWKGNMWLGLVLFAAMALNLTISGLAGAAFPLLLKAIGQDPAMGSGVLVTTFTDITGFLSFLGLATIFIEYL